MKIVAQLMKVREKNSMFSQNDHFGPDISAFGCFKGGVYRTLNEKINPMLFFESWCCYYFEQCI
jgi:hypothetical protein